MGRTIHIKDARVESQENLPAQIVRDHMLLHIKGVQNTNTKKTGVQTTCGKQPKVIRLSTKSKHSPAVKTNSDIHFYCRAAHKIRSQCGYSNRPNTSLQPKSETRLTRSEI